MKESRKLVVVVSRGADDERASVAWSVANGGIASGMQVHMFLVSSGVDWVRRKAALAARPNPLDPPMQEMIDRVRDSGGRIMVCPPCARVRGYEADDLLDGVELAGSVSMHELILEGAATLSF